MPASCCCCCVSDDARGPKRIQTRFNYPQFSVIEQRLSIREGRPVEKDAYSGSTRWPCARFEVIDSLDRPRGDRIARMRAQQSWRAAEHRVEHAFGDTSKDEQETYFSLFNGVLRSFTIGTRISFTRYPRLGPSSPLAQGSRCSQKGESRKFVLTARENSYANRLTEAGVHDSSDERSLRTLFILPR